MKDYYKKTILAKKRAFSVISLEEYKKRLFADAPEMESFEQIWSFLKPKSCYSNALFLCWCTIAFKKANESFDYCEGVVINRREIIYGNPTAIHHSWVFSNKYKCYVDCTPPEIDCNLYYYYLSNTLKNIRLYKYLNSIYDEENDMYIPSFINKDLPLGLKVPLEWLYSSK